MVQEHIRLKHLQRDEEEKSKQLSEEKSRTSQGKQMLRAKAQFQEDEMRRSVEQKKREKEEDRKYR